MIETSDPLEKMQMRRSPSARSKLQGIFPSLATRPGGGSRGGGEAAVEQEQKCLAKRVQTAYRYIKQHSIDIHD